MHREVSVIIPCFKAHDTIQRCVDSIVRSCPLGDAVEILLESDDGTDYGWVSNIYPRVHSYSSGICASGPGLTRNRAFKRARGKWVTFVDSDDYVEEEYLREMHDACRRNGAALAITQVVDGDSVIGRYGSAGGVLDFSDWSATGVSVRGMFPRAECPIFYDKPSQDVFHLVEFMMNWKDTVAFCAARYNLFLNSSSVTRSSAFPELVHSAYLDYVGVLEAHYPNNYQRRKAIEFFEEKIRLNALYDSLGSGYSFYRQVFGNLGSLAA